MFRLTVLGDITAEPASNQSPLDTSTRRLVSVLVARGGQPVSAMDLAYEVGVRPSALKNWLYRRRQTLGVDLFPKGGRGAPGYRLEIGRDEVDAWWLHDRFDQPLDQASDDQLLAVLSSGEPFPGVPDTDSDLLSSARGRIKHAQRSLAISVVRADRRVVMAGIVELVQELLGDDPYDEELAEINARLRSVLFGRRHGLEALHQTRLQLLESGLSPSSALEALEASLLDDSTTDAEPRLGRAPARSAGLRRPLRTGLPASLEALRATPLAARSEPVLPQSSRSGASWIVVPGPSGAGKTSFMAEVAAAAANAGSSVLHMEPFRFGPEPWFRFFAEAFPDVKGLIEELTDARADIAAFRHSVVVALQANLRDLATAGPLVVVVSQAHRLESETIEALWYLVRSSMPNNLTFLIGGDTSQPGRSLAGVPDGPGGSAAWESFVEGLVASGMGSAVDLPPLDVEQVDGLIRRYHPKIERNRALLLAPRIAESSGGLPGLALPLIRNLNSGTDNAVDDGPASVDPLRQMVATMPEQIQTVGAAAAVCGLRFSANDVEALTGFSKSTVVEIFTTLYRKDLIVVEPPIGHYRFTTAQVAQVFLFTAPPEQRQIWHQRAAELLRHDPVRRARHVVAVSDGPEAVQAVIEAAEANVVLDQHHEAVAEYDRAVQLLSGPLPPSNCAGFVRALDLSGRHADAEKVRRSALDGALELGDHSTALAVLLASWPEAEAFADPDQMVARLDAIDPTQLAADEQVLYAHHWSRHLSLAGRAEDAIRVIEQAEAMAITPSEQVDLALAARYAKSARWSPGRCIDLLDEVRLLLQRVDVARRADFLTHQAIDAYEHGTSERFETVRDELWAIVDQSSPVRRWHALLLDGVRAADFDDRSAAAAHRQAAFEHAVGHGMRHAIGVKLVGEWAEQWLLGLPLGPTGELGSEEVTALERNPPIVDAGMAFLLEAAGEHDRALSLAENVAEAAVARPNRRSAPSIAIVASILARTRRDQLRIAAKDLLLWRGDVLLLLGAFAAGLGPATRYAEYLETSRSERSELRRRSRRLAEQTSSPRWLRLTDPDG